MSPVTIYVNFLFHPDALNWNNDANRTEQYYVDWSNEVIAEANYWLANMEQNQNVGPNGVQAPLVPDAKFRLQILTDENAPNDSGIYFQGLFNNPIHGNNNSINIRVLGEGFTTLCYDDYAGDAPAIGTGAVGQQNGAVRLFNPVCSPGIPGNPNEPHQGIRSLWGRVLNHEIGHNLNLQHSASCNNV